MRKGILTKEAENGKRVSKEVDVCNLGVSERKLLVQHILKVVEEDNERFLHRLKSRIVQFGALYSYYIGLDAKAVSFLDFC